MLHKKPRIGQELLDVPMGDMIKDMAFSIAEAQMKLDQNSMEVAEMMGGLKTITHTDDEGNETVTYKDSRVFFGEKKLTLKDVVATFNSENNDPSYRAQLREKLIGNATISYPSIVKELTSKVQIGADSTLGTTEDYGVFLDTSRGIEFWFANDNNDKWMSIAPPNVSATAALVSTANEDLEVYIPQRLSMMELGFTPTFYQFVDTIIEVKINIKYTREGSSSFSYSKTTKDGLSLNWGRRLSYNRNATTTQVNAGFSQKYSYSAEGSSLLRTKLVPIPPPAILEERIQQQMEIVKENASS